MGMGALIERFERVLKIDVSRPPETLMRIRAAYAVGVMLVATQMLNMAIMGFSYGRWTEDHFILSVACTIVTVAVFSIRYYKNAAFYAALYGGLVVVGAVASAWPDHGGINSAALPFLALGPVICGFMAGRVGAIASFLAGVVVLALLFWISLAHPPLMASGDHTREINRFVQGFFALSMSAVISVFISERIYLLVAEQREAADRARRAEAEKSAFLATMSHELRTPLNGVVGLADALSRSNLAAREKSLVDTIAQSSECMLRILNDLLDMSKMEAGKLRIDPRPAAPRALILHVADAWRETANERQLKIAVDVDPSTPERVVIDDLRVTQILQNLVSNAIKFSEHGFVVISLKSAPAGDLRTRLEFRVSDSGRGIPPAFVDRIFDPYEQGGHDVARKSGGTGLGLSISRQLAILMGGALCVERTGRDGTTFLFSLVVDAAPRQPVSHQPVSHKPAPHKAEAAAPDSAPNAGYSKLRVLVADDNEVNRLVLAEFLRGFGIAAIFAVDGAQCVKIARAGVFNLILIDRYMPGVDGIEATRAIRAEGASRRAVIVAVTGDGADDSERHFEQAGADARIVKPVTRGAIAAALENAAIRNIAA